MTITILDNFRHKDVKFKDFLMQIWKQATKGTVWYFHYAFIQKLVCKLVCSHSNLLMACLHYREKKWEMIFIILNEKTGSKIILTIWHMQRKNDWNESLMVVICGERVKDDLYFPLNIFLLSSRFSTALIFFLWIVIVRPFQTLSTVPVPYFSLPMHFPCFLYLFPSVYPSCSY